MTEDKYLMIKIKAIYKNIDEEVMKYGSTNPLAAIFMDWVVKSFVKYMPEHEINRIDELIIKGLKYEQQEARKKRTIKKELKTNEKSV